MQRVAGNAAVASKVAELQRQIRPSVSASRRGAGPGWSREQLRMIQRELRRLGLYNMPINGVFGPGTQAGLVEAFGDNDWVRLPVSEVIARVRAAAPSRGGTRGEHRLRYGEMFRDGVLDMTVAIGFDETGAHTPEVQEIRTALGNRGFVVDRREATVLLKQAGRTVGPTATGDYYVRREALTYRPPAGPSRKIHAVVRLIDAGTGGRGAESASALREGIAASDVTAYAGHGRYGSGPDFDRNFARFELLDATGAVTRTLFDYEVLQRELRAEGRPHGRTAWQQFLWRDAHHRIEVVGSHPGNVYLNPRNLHEGEFGARLIYWSLRREGRQPATGRRGSLRTEVRSAQPEHQYRVLLFDGCRTQDYVQSLRSTPGFDTRSTDVMTTQRITYWRDKAEAISSFLDALILQQSAEETIRGMDAQEQTGPEASTGGAFAGSGLGDNPLIK